MVRDGVLVPTSGRNHGQIRWYTPKSKPEQVRTPILPDTTTQSTMAHLAGEAVSFQSVYLHLVHRADSEDLQSYIEEMA